MGLGSAGTTQDNPVNLSLSDDEVIANALSRQQTDKANNTNGLRVTYVDSPEQQNAKNGGLNVTVTGPAPKDVLNPMTRNKQTNNMGFANYTSMAFSRDRIARQESFIP